MTDDLDTMEARTIARQESIFLTLKAIESALDRNEAKFDATEFATLEQAKRTLAGEIGS